MPNSSTCPGDDLAVLLLFRSKEFNRPRQAPPSTRRLVPIPRARHTTYHRLFESPPQRGRETLQLASRRSSKKVFRSHRLLSRCIRDCCRRIRKISHFARLQRATQWGRRRCRFRHRETLLWAATSESNPGWSPLSPYDCRLSARW